MKKIILILAVLAIYQNWSTIRNFITPPVIPEIAAEQEVILYATTWCGYCKKTREFLADNNIDYYEYDIEYSSEGKRQYTQLNGQGVPLLVVNEQVIRGYNPPAILKALKQ